MQKHILKYKEALGGVYMGIFDDVKEVGFEIEKFLKIILKKKNLNHSEGWHRFAAEMHAHRLSSCGENEFKDFGAY